MRERYSCFCWPHHFGRLYARAFSGPFADTSNHCSNLQTFSLAVNFTRVSDLRGKLRRCFHVHELCPAVGCVPEKPVESKVALPRGTKEREYASPGVADRHEKLVDETLSSFFAQRADSAALCKTLTAFPSPGVCENKLLPLDV